MGAFYALSPLVEFSGDTSNASGSTQLVANGIEFQGIPAFGDSCAGTGITPIGGRVRLTS